VGKVVAVNVLTPVLGQPSKFEWICKEKIALRKSKNHARGDKYFESTTMDAVYFEKDLRRIGKAICTEYTKLNKASVRVKLQIDLAGGHGMARGHGNFDRLKAMMLKDFNVDLVQQLGNTPMYNILDLNLCQACQLEVDKMNKDTRHSESKLVEVCKEAWTAMPAVKILQALEMRNDCAQEAFETEGYCPNEGNGRGGGPRVHEHEAYADLRARLEIS
jgi:hypothetical protein